MEKSVYIAEMYRVVVRWVSDTKSNIPAIEAMSLADALIEAAWDKLSNGPVEAKRAEAINTGLALVVERDALKAEVERMRPGYDAFEARADWAETPPVDSPTLSAAWKRAKDAEDRAYAARAFARERKP